MNFILLGPDFDEFFDRSRAMEPRVPRRSQISSFGLFIGLVLILAASLASPAHGQTSGTDYPLCPFSGNYPSKPNVTMPRCPGAQEFTCCEDCYDR